jgi:AcrR family transcriptional regulator
VSEQDSDDVPESTDATQVMRPARRRNPEESQRRILDAAERAFALRGFGGARLRDIAQEAGVHHALVHHYFGDKRGLLEEVTRRGLSRISDAALTALEAPTTLESTVRAFVAVLFDFCANNRNLLRIIEDAFRNREWASFEIIQEALGALAGPLLSTLRHRIETGQRSGQVRTDLTSEALILLGFGAIVYRFDIAEGLLVAMGLPQRSETDLAKEREDTIKYVLAAMRAEKP